MKRLSLLAISVVATTLVSCNKSGLEVPPAPGEPNALPVQISLTPALMEQPGGGFSAAASLSQTKVSDQEGLVVQIGGEDTKAATDLPKAADSKVLNVWAIQYTAAGVLVGTPYYTADIPIAGAGSSGIDATYSLSVNLTSSTEAKGKVYFIANTNSPTYFNTSNAATEAKLKELAQSMSIGNQLIPTAESGIPMLGSYEGAVSSGTAIGNVTMKRLVAKVILKYKINTAFAGFEITSVTLKNVASNIYFGQDPVVVTTNYPAKNTTEGSESHQDYAAENLTSAGTDGDYKKFTWYVPENWRGITAGIGAVGDRILGKTDGMATYLEIKGTLKSAVKCEKATYSILLGDPVTNKGDFNVKRNTVYTVTVDILGTNTADHRIAVESFDQSNSAIVVPNSGNAGAVTFDIRKLTNGWKTTMPALGSSAALRAEVLWQDGNVINPADVTLDKLNGLLTVRSSKATDGNAIVALYNNATAGSGEILWSWHVWVTGYNPDGSKAYGLGANSKATVAGGQVHTYGVEFQKVNPNKVIMDRNLGATRTYYSAPLTKDTLVADLAYGMFYQWGRKDPFPRVLGKSINATSATGTTIPIYGANGTTALADEVSDAAGTGLRKMNITGAGILSGTNTLPYSVKNPLAFIYNALTPYDWYTTLAANQNNILWGDKAVKSAYDPCPKGWRVAPNGTWSDFTRDAAVPLDGTFPYYINVNKVNTPKENGAAGDYFSTNGRLYKVSTTGNGTPLAWYPAPGFRDYGRAGFEGVLRSVGNNGYSWSSSVDGGISGRYLYFNAQDLIPSSACCRAHGFPVRCLQE